MPRYKCLVLDHDDTAVMSTPGVHYPSFVNALAHLRPGTSITREEYVRLCYDPGFERMCLERFGFNTDEMAWQLEYWKRYVEKHVPPFYPGIAQIIARQQAEGGLVCVVSQSYARFVLRDYAAAGVPAPHRVLGWELGSLRQKPPPDPLYMLMEEFSLAPADILMVDDLKPGFDMARAAGCAYAAALWAYESDPDMQQLVLSGSGGAIPLANPAALEALLFGPDIP